MRSLAGIGIATCLAMWCAVASAVTCTLAVTGMSFGSYDLFSASPLDTTGNVAVTCQKDTIDGNNAIVVAYLVALSAGSSNSFVQRSMLSSGQILGYNVYSNSTRTAVWGDGAGASQLSGSMKLINPRDIITNNHTAYGRAPAAQDVGAGIYSDTLLLTLNW